MESAIRRLEGVSDHRREAAGIPRFVLQSVQPRQFQQPWHKSDVAHVRSTDRDDGRSQDHRVRAEVLFLTAAIVRGRPTLIVTLG
jgi:hypothetical protein